MPARFDTAPDPPALIPDTVIRLGLIAVATDLTLEGDLPVMLPDVVRLHVTRVAFDNPTTPENLTAMLPRLAGAADLLVPGVPLAAIGYGCTAAGAVLGDAAIAATRPGVPVISPAMAGRMALAALGVQRIALLTPYLARTTAPVITYFEGHGLEVVSAYGLGLADDRDIACLAPADIVAGVRAADHPRAQALFVACTAVPILGLIDRIEAALGKPVVTANQALGWALAAAAGLSVHGPGALCRAPTLAMPAP